MNVLWSFLNAAVGFTVPSKHANGDSCAANGLQFSGSPACLFAVVGPQADGALGDSFAPLDAVAVGAGDRKAGNRDCVASKRVSMGLTLEKQAREVGSTLRQPRNPGANPANE